MSSDVTAHNLSKLILNRSSRANYHSKRTFHCLFLIVLACVTMSQNSTFAIPFESPTLSLRSFHYYNFIIFTQFGCQKMSAVYL